MASAWPGFGGITSMFSGLARGRQRSQLQQFALHDGEFCAEGGAATQGRGMVSFWCVGAVLTLHLPDVTTARSNAMTEPKKPPTLSRPRQLPKALKGPSHRDRRRAKPTKVYDLDVEEARETRPQPSLPPVRWLSRKDVD